MNMQICEMNLKTLISCSLIFAGLGVLTAEPADAQLFSRLRGGAMVGTGGGQGTFDRFGQNNGYNTNPSNTYSSSEYPNYTPGTVYGSSNTAYPNSGTSQYGTSQNQGCGCPSQGIQYQGGSVTTRTGVIPGGSQANSSSARTDQLQNTDHRQMSAATDSQAMDQFFASQLVLCNNEEIQAAQKAVKKVINAEVKSFAEMLVKDHQNLNQKLSRFVPVYAETAIMDATNHGISSKNQSFDTKTSDANMTGDDSTFAKLYEVCRKASDFKKEQCEKMMLNYSGEELDMAFLGAQMAGHQMLLAELKAMESSSSSEFQSVIRDAKKGVETHLETATRLTDKLSQSNSLNFQDK